MAKVEIGYRDCNIMYNVDRWSVEKMANHYGIEWSDMKKVLRSYGFTIRKGEVKPPEAPKPYIIDLVDVDKIVAKIEE